MHMYYIHDKPKEGVIKKENRKGKGRKKRRGKRLKEIREMGRGSGKWRIFK